MAGTGGGVDLNDRDMEGVNGEAAEVRKGAAVVRRRPWTAVEDAILKEYMNAHGPRDWKKVPGNSGLDRYGKTWKSCRLRWLNHLRPDLRKGPFSAEEELRITQLHALDMEGVNSEAAEARKGAAVVRRRPWTAVEDAILKEFMNTHGPRDWKKVPGNSGLDKYGKTWKSCRLRWLNHLRPDLRKGPFSAEEELRITQLHALLSPLNREK
ncbi:Transcription factor GAMYB [Acorus calamus]|uniref:Transcription factor GAMYB n=1 Tax=Acorus calamus TaxID=4465 RepID=A0AAV9DTC2_ACOCL|nr:Transcription factor GAMYB [Acorus calamus]